ncbi:DUF6884 domain-containing protein [Streptomyces jumonjinensis]|uniref:DUF6884 domain-containing protein n=1 Tax=Streptomyces jumonjinensis TaxID=1945 RepID=UPI003792621E
MRDEHLTRSAVHIDHHGDATASVEFAPAGGAGRTRARAVWRLAVIYRVAAVHPRRTRHYNPASPDAPAPAADELRLDLSGTPERVARLLSAIPRYLDALDSVATRAARTYGRWSRSIAGETALEYTDSPRAHARQFRARALSAAADYLGITSLSPGMVDDSRPLWGQAAAVVYALVKTAAPVSLYAMHDPAEAEEILAAADRTPDPAAIAYERELAELHAADVRRRARLSAALDGQELAADEDTAGVTPSEDTDEDQEHEELAAAPLTAVQRRWLHTAAAHPEGHLPEAVNLRTVRALGAAGLIEWARSYATDSPVAETLWKPRAGEVRVTAAGRRRAAREGRERVVIVACGGRKAVYTDGPRKGEPVIGARAGELYTGSYHRAARRAADALTRGGRAGRVLILSARWGLVELSQHLLNYNLRAGDVGTVDGETLRRQAHELGISGAAVTVLGGRAYAELAWEVWGDSLDTPLAGTRGIGEQLARLADLYDPARRPAEDAVGEVREDQAEELLRAEELPHPSAAPLTHGGPRRPASTPPLRRDRGSSCAASFLGFRPDSRPSTWERTTVHDGLSGRPLALPPLLPRRSEPIFCGKSAGRAGGRKTDAHYLECCAGLLRRRRCGHPEYRAEPGKPTDERTTFHAVICTCRFHGPPGVGGGLGKEGRRSAPLRFHGGSRQGRPTSPAEGDRRKDPRHRQSEGRRGEDHHHRQSGRVHA